MGDELTMGDRLHLGERLTVSSQGPLRVPDDGRHCPLSPTLDGFPLRRLQDSRTRTPTTWKVASEASGPARKKTTGLP